MKFWKQTLLTAFCFFSIASTVFYTSCEKDSCADLVCINSGTCSAGICSCKTGWEGTSCQTRVISRYLGTYYGYVMIDNLPSIQDTVVIYPTSDSMNVIVAHAYLKDTAYATVSSTPSSFTINIPVDSNYARRIVAAATVEDNTLKLNTYIHRYTDTTDHSYIFQGNK